MPGPLPKAPRQFHRWLILCAIGMFALLALYEVAAFFRAGRDPLSLVIGLVAAGLSLGLVFYLGWFMRRSADLR